MKANELMIGDWVYDTILKCNTQVEMLYLSGIRGDCHDSIWNENTFEPIPITTEILEKNGWVYIAEDKVFYPENLKGELPWIYYITDGSNEVFRMQDFCNLQYVHELQQALRLCRIEKTIEL